MGASLGHKRQAISDINVTPFVDVVLVLLVVLMVAAVQIVRGAIPVDLPKAASAGQAVSSTLNVTIAKDGALVLDGKALPADELGRRVVSAHRADADVRAVIAADKGVAYEHVMRVIDIVKTSGVAKFALSIERRGEP